MELKEKDPPVIDGSSAKIISKDKSNYRCNRAGMVRRKLQRMSDSIRHHNLLQKPHQ